MTVGVPGCFYHRLGSDGDLARFASTDETRSNWSREIQHGSPPLALLTKAVEEVSPPGMRLGRVSMDLLGAVPVGEVAVRAWTQRPGRRICLMAAEMTDPSGRAVARLSAWALAVSDTSDVACDRYPPLIEGDTAALAWGWRETGGYLDTVQWRPQHGESAGAAVYWVRPMSGLVDDEPTTALQRLTMVVDSANGIGGVLDPERFVYMNTDTTLHLHRLPTGQDFGIRARASIGPDGIGVTTAEIFDTQGFVGTSAQTLLVQRT